MHNPYTIYCDYDSVLVDFYRGTHDILGGAWDDPRWKGPERRAERGRIINSHPNFWSTLPPERDYDQLWSFIKNFSPHILTAYPDWDKEGAQKGKWEWNQKHTKVPHDRFHCVERENKRYYAKDGVAKPNVLIDDFPQNILEWTRAGGIGILHTSAADTIQKLKKLGFST
jgi:hypothetical protein